MNEHSFVKAIHRRLSDEVFTWKINDNYAGGVPDAWYCGSSGGHLFVEYKYVKLPARATTTLSSSLSALQLSWLLDKQLRGVPTALIIGAEDKAIIIADYSCVGSITKADFEKQAVSFDGVANFIDGVVNGR